MDRISFESRDPILDRLSKAAFPEEGHLKNLGVMASHHSNGIDYIILYDKPNGLDISTRVAVEWIKRHIPKDLPIIEDISSGTVSQETSGNGGDKKFVRRYSLFRGSIDEYFAQIEASKYAFEC